MHNPSVAEHPNQILKKKVLINGTCYPGDKNLKILHRTCNFWFAFLPNVLRCSLKSSLLSMMAPRNFSEAL